MFPLSVNTNTLFILFLRDKIFPFLSSLMAIKVVDPSIVQILNFSLQTIRTDTVSDF